MIILQSFPSFHFLSFLSLAFVLPAVFFLRFLPVSSFIHFSLFHGIVLDFTYLDSIQLGLFISFQVARSP